MLGDKCLAHSQHFDSSHKFSVRLRSGLCAGQTEQGKTISSWSWLCAAGHCHAEAGKDLPRTVATKWEARYYLKYHCVLQNKDTNQKQTQVHEHRENNHHKTSHFGHFCVSHFYSLSCFLSSCISLFLSLFLLLISFPLSLRQVD